MTALSGRTQGLDRMVSKSRDTNAFDQQMSGLVGILLRLIDDQGSIILHVTAPNAGEGTSTIARGLATAAAQAPWCKVALLDASGSTDSVVGADALPSVLDGFDPTKKIPLATRQLNGVGVSAGILNLSGPAAPSLETLRSLYGALRADFTLTVVDCPPVNASQTTVAYSKLADGVVLVISAERTRVGDIERAQGNLTHFGATILGSVMNQSRRRVPRFIDRFL